MKTLTLQALSLVILVGLAGSAFAQTTEDSAAKTENTPAVTTENTSVNTPVEAKQSEDKQAAPQKNNEPSVPTPKVSKKETKSKEETEIVKKRVCPMDPKDCAE